MRHSLSRQVVFAKWMVQALSAGGWLSPHGSLSHIRDWLDMGDLPLIAEAYYNARSQMRAHRRRSGERDLNELHYQTRAILFDLDGTLIDSTDLILQCFQYSWETVCGYYHSREALVRTFGTPLRAAMHRLLLAAAAAKNANHSTEVDTDIVNQLLAEYCKYNVDNHDLLARPFVGTGEVLAELRRRGYLIAVVTSKSRELGLRGL